MVEIKIPGYAPVAIKNIMMGISRVFFVMFGLSMSNVKTKNNHGRSANPLTISTCCEFAKNHQKN